ncbi:hypothetical protein L610_004700000140 [Aminobacter sp. J44]|nr:hypothetical protein L610_004700000140 [Aminobacter sp. J44]
MLHMVPLPRFAGKDPTSPLLILPRLRGRWREAPEGPIDAGAVIANTLSITATSHGTLSS